MFISDLITVVNVTFLYYCTESCNYVLLNNNGYFAYGVADDICTHCR